MAEPAPEPPRTQVGFRMLNEHVGQLDKLCDINKRSRREIIEILVEEAHGAWEDNHNDRINPA